jgi:DNA topoisomerase VI subunit B
MIDSKLTPAIYSDEAQTTDYISIKGIRTRLGITDKYFDVFIIKELIDNALDFIETNAKKFVGLNQNPYVHLIVSTVEEEEGKNKVTKIVVRNSNAGINVFSKERVEKIFNFENYNSSKRNRYQISRGALGGALKDILGIPYALAVEGGSQIITNYEDWKYPLQINIANDKSILK